MISLSTAFNLRFVFFFFQAEDGIRDVAVTGVQTCALPIWRRRGLQAARPLLGPSVSSGVFDDAIRGRHARHANTEQPARIDRVPFPILTGREKLISSSRRMAWQSSAPGGAEARLNAELVGAKLRPFTQRISGSRKPARIG